MVITPDTPDSSFTAVYYPTEVPRHDFVSNLGKLEL